MLIAMIMQLRPRLRKLLASGSVRCATKIAMNQRASRNLGRFSKA
jgi:hypothetical protein